MNKIDQCTSIDELKNYSMQDLCSLYSKIVKAPAPKFSDKAAAAKRILPLLEQKRAEANPVAVPELDSIFELEPAADGVRIVIKGEASAESAPSAPSSSKRGRPSGQLSSRRYVVDFDKFWLQQRELPPQARQIIESLSKTNEQEFLESELPGLLLLKTKQDPWRIFQYYRPKLIAAGVLRVINAA